MWPNGDKITEYIRRSSKDILTCITFIILSGKQVDNDKIALIWRL